MHIYLPQVIQQLAEPFWVCKMRPEIISGQMSKAREHD